MKLQYNILLSLSAGLSLLILGGSAIAETATFEITATVFDISDPNNSLQNSVGIGDSITGTYTIELTTPDDDPSPQMARYHFNTQNPNNPQLGFDLILNSHSLKSDPLNSAHMYEAYVLNDYSDHYGLTSWGNMPLSNGNNVDDIFLDLYDPTGTALNNTSLSNIAPDVNAFEYRDMYISGNTPNGGYYSITAKIQSISSPAGNCQPGNSNLVTFDITASIKEVWDYDNVIFDMVRPGDEIFGSYTFNKSTIDMDPNPDFGHYVHNPGSGNYGFDLMLNGASIKTDQNIESFVINVEDFPAGPASYSAHHFNNIAKPFLNNTVIDYIDLFIFDNTGLLNNSTTLSDQPPSLSNVDTKEIYLGGFGNPPFNSSYFSIVADITSITNSADICEEENNPVSISPATGVFDWQQNFDAAIILDSGLPPVMHMEGTLNGFDITPELSNCFPGSPNSQNRQTFVCPGFSHLLYPGNNNLSVNFHFSDGIILSNSVDWMVLSY